MYIERSSNFLKLRRDPNPAISDSQIESRIVVSRAKFQIRVAIIDHTTPLAPHRIWFIRCSALGGGDGPSDLLSDAKALIGEHRIADRRNCECPRRRDNVIAMVRRGAILVWFHPAIPQSASSAANSRAIEYRVYKGECIMETEHFARNYANFSLEFYHILVSKEYIREQFHDDSNDPFLFYFVKQEIFPMRGNWVLWTSLKNLD